MFYLLQNIKRNFVEYDSKIKWLVFCFIFCFTIGAWLDINGLWCELPIMVHELPEKWRLPSILSASTQIAQIAPIIFILGKWKFPNQFTYVRAIYLILIIGALSCMLLAFFWNKTAFILNEDRSIGLIILNFSLALLDGTSSVTFLPYISGNFIKEYIIPNYIGESLAALIPSVLSLIQGLGQNPGCYNVTDPINNQTVLIPRQIVPNYSVKIYFILMFLLLCLSITAFSLLNFSQTAIKERKSNAISNISNHASTNRVDVLIDQSNESFESKSPDSNDSSIVSQNGSQAPLVNNQESNSSGGLIQFLVDKRGSNDKLEKIVLNFYIFMVSFICYGVLPGLQSYSTLPYGNDVFNYAVNISFVCIPIAVFLSIWSYHVTILQISVEFSIACGFSLYILVLSILSPCPPLYGTHIGSILSILSWIFSQSMFMRVRLLVAARLERFGQKALLILGSLTMIGQIFGGLIIYVIVNTFELLVSKPDCVFDYSYCKK